MFRLPPKNKISSSSAAADVYKSTVQASAGRIAVMAGSGVNASNVKLFADTGVDAIHFSARNLTESRMTYKNPSISMGGVQGIPEYASIGIDPTMIRNILNQLI